MDELGVLLGEILVGGEVVYKGAGWLGLVGFLLPFVIRLWRLDFLQAALPDGLKWLSWPMWLRKLIPYIFAASASAIAAVVGGMPWPQAIIGGLIAALSAVGIHKETKAAGLAMAARAKAKDASYSPGLVRHVLKPVLPLPRQALKL